MKEFIRELNVKIEKDTNKQTDVLSLFLHEFDEDETTDEFVKRVIDYLRTMLEDE